MTERVRKKPFKKMGAFLKSKWMIVWATIKRELFEIGKSFAYFGHLIGDRFSYYVFRKKNAKKPEPIFFRGQTNITFLLAVIALLAFGLVTLFSASYVEAYEDNPKTKIVEEIQIDGTVVEVEEEIEKSKGGYTIFFNQLMIALLGLFAMWVASHVRIDVYRKLAGFMFVISLLLLVYVLLNPVVEEGKEHIKRWIKVPIFGTLQPSEIAKLTLILYMASIMERYQKYIQKTSWALFPIAVPLIIVLGLMLPESHTSGLIIIMAIGASMLFFGGIKMRWFIIGGTIVVVAVAAVYFYGVYLVENDAVENYVQGRVAVWVKLLSNYELTSDERRDGAWQSLQSLYAVGSGGLFGLGFGQSKQKHMYLPEPHNDFIFAVICEELGFFRAIIVMIAFLLLVVLGMYIASQARSKFAAMIAMGLSFKVGLQALLNFGVVTSTIPNTGISLPFFSSGGTALLLQLVEMGIILAVARESRKKGSYALQ